MKKIKFSRLFFLLTTIVILLSAGLFFISRQSSILVNAPKPLKSLVSSIDQLVTAPIDFVGQIGKLLQADSENKDLKEQVEKLTVENKQADSLRKENESLKASLKIVDNFSDYQVLTGRVVVRSPISWLDLLNIDLGSKDGVSQGMLATSDGGLIGKVSQVTGTSSTVRLLSNTVEKDEIPVKIVNSGADVFGILTAYDEEAQTLEVSKLNSSSAIEVGDVVETSGLDGKTVSGLSVGKVKAIKTSADSLSRTIFVEPTADFSNISYVTLVGN